MRFYILVSNITDKKVLDNRIFFISNLKNNKYLNKMALWIKMKKISLIDGLSHYFKKKLNSFNDEEFNGWLRYQLSTCERESYHRLIVIICYIY